MRYDIANFLSDVRNHWDRNGRTGSAYLVRGSLHGGKYEKRQGILLGLARWLC